MGTLGKHWKLSEATKAKMRKPKSVEHRSAISAGKKGKPSRLPGFSHSEETKQKIAEKAKGRHPSDEVRARMSAKRKGNPGFWLGKKRGPQSAEWRANISKANFGKPAYYPMRRYHYGGAALRSSWELEAAKAFDQRGIVWQFEPRKFDLGSETYTPDFYLPEQDCWWEIKGWHGPKAKKTVALFREKFPEESLVVATRDVLAKLGVTQFRHKGA